MKKIDKFIKDLANKYPNLIRNVDKFSEFFDTFMFAYLSIVLITIFGVIFIFYFALPKDYRNEFSAIIGTLVSIVIIPFALKIYEQMKENKKQRFLANYNLYLELISIFSDLIYNYDLRVNNLKRFESFINTHCSEMYLNFTYNLNSTIFSVYREYSNNNKENVIYYSEKCIKLIRKEGNVGKDFRHFEIIQNIMKK